MPSMNAHLSLFVETSNFFFVNVYAFWSLCAQIPTILEIPSKDAPYDPNQDSVMMRIQKKMSMGKWLHADK